MAILEGSLYGNIHHWDPAPTGSTPKISTILETAILFECHPTKHTCGIISDININIKYKFITFKITRVSLSMQGCHSTTGESCCLLPLSLTQGLQTQVREKWSKLLSLMQGESETAAKEVEGVEVSHSKPLLLAASSAVKLLFERGLWTLFISSCSLLNMRCRISSERLRLPRQFLRGEKSDRWERGLEPTSYTLWLVCSFPGSGDFTLYSMQQTCCLPGCCSDALFRMQRLQRKDQRCCWRGWVLYFHPWHPCLLFPSWHLPTPRGLAA